jgi:oxalate decarboxylase
MTIDTKPSRHVVSLSATPASYANASGKITRADAATLPLLKGLSLRRLELERDTLREPHWHANAHELGYCLKGTALVTILRNHAVRDSFVVRAGDMFFAPSGSLHTIRNIGDETAAFVLALSHEKPEDFGLSASFGAMTPSVLGNTFDGTEQSFSALRTASQEKPELEIVPLSRPLHIEPQALHSSPLKFRIEETQAQINSGSGTARQSKAALWPALEGLAMFSVRISDTGMREPHWHPETAEMGYVVDGEARMTILDPDGSTDTYLLKAGDVYYIPPAYPHHIENIGEGTTHFLIFFNRTAPGDIGFCTLVGGLSRDELAATFHVEQSDLPELPFMEEDPLMVHRVNAVEPVA